MNDYPDEETSEDDDEVTSGSSDEKSEGESTKSEGESTTSGSQSEELEGGGSQVSYEYEGSELYDWSDYGCEQTLEDCEGDEEHHW